jgi:hypothetical protein
VRLAVSKLLTVFTRALIVTPKTLAWKPKEGEAEMKRRTITVEIDRVVMVSQHRSGRVAWCAACASRVRMVAADEAAGLAHASSRTIYRWVEAHQLHFTETPEGQLFICLNSLAQKTLEDEI